MTRDDLELQTLAKAIELDNKPSFDLSELDEHDAHAVADLLARSLTPPVLIVRNSDL